jgi:hypothetical protein
VRSEAQVTVNKLAKRLYGWLGVVLFVGMVGLTSVRCGSGGPQDMWITKDPDAGAGFEAPVREVGGGDSSGTAGAGGQAGAAGAGGAGGQAGDQGGSGGDTGAGTAGNGAAGTSGAAGTGGAAGDGTAGNGTAGASA